MEITKEIITNTDDMEMGERFMSALEDLIKNVLCQDMTGVNFFRIDVDYQKEKIRVDLRGNADSAGG